MKIGLLLPALPGYSETFFRSKIKGLQEKGHEVLLFTGSRQHTYSPDLNCAVYCSPNLSGSALKRIFHSSMALVKLLLTAPASAFKLFRLHRQLGDSWAQSLRSLVINSHILPHRLDWLHFGFATIGVGRELLGKAIGAKVAVSFRGYDINQYPLSTQLNVYHRLWKHTDKIHSISQSLLKTAREQLALPHNITHAIIYPAVDVLRFSSHTDAPQSTDSALLRCLLVSRLHWIKNIESVLEAMAIAIQKGLNMQLYIAGTGSEEERLRFAAHQLGVGGYITWMGNVEHEQVPKLMHEHDIFIQYSFEEGFCNAVLEAQAAGMLVVVSDAEGLSENVVHGQTGWVVPKLKPEALASTLIEVANLDKAQQTFIKNNASNRVQRHFRIEQQQQAFLQFYEA